MSDKIKILIVIGTRPEAIKMAPVWAKLRASEKFEVCTLDSGQHPSLMKPILDVFDWIPNYSCNLSSSHSDLFDLLLQLQMQINSVVLKEQPDLVLTHGDTATTIATSIVCSMHKIRLGHVEAGLRSKNKYEPWPEEINRKVTDILSDYHFCPTDTARNNLLSEGLPSETILVTGNTVVDALHMILERLRDERLSDKIGQKFNFLCKEKKLVLVTGHRRENFGDNFYQLVRSLAKLNRCMKCQMIFVAHPNGQLKAQFEASIDQFVDIKIIDPPDYLEFVYLMKRSDLIITDSGGIQEEAPTLRKNVIVTRNVTEREEGISTGHIHLTGCDEDKIVSTAEAILKDGVGSESINPYGDGSAAEKIKDYLLANL